MRIHHVLVAVTLCAGAAHAHPGGHGDPPSGAREAAPVPAARTVAISCAPPGQFDASSVGQVVVGKP